VQILHYRSGYRAGIAGLAAAALSLWAARGCRERSALVGLAEPGYLEKAQETHALSAGGSPDDPVTKADVSGGRRDAPYEWLTGMRAVPKRRRTE
jgi:hypothetical protein